MKRSSKIKKAIITVIVSLLCIVLLAVGGYYGYCIWFGYQIDNYFESLAYVNRFEDFSSVEGDFKIVADMVLEHKTEIMNNDSHYVYMDVNDDGVPSAGIVKRDSEGLVSGEFELSEDEKKAVNTVHNSLRYLNIVFFLEDDCDDLFFVGEDGYYAVVYSPSDSPNERELRERMGRKAAIVKLDKCWYQVGRV